jgi:peptidoglycan/LPS O-acetylase OafA/YrhL
VDYDGGDTINGPIWTLHFEWMCYILLGGLALLGVMARRWVFLALYVAAISMLVFYVGESPADQSRGRLFMFLFLFSYFGAGVLIYLFGDVLRWSLPLMGLTLLALIGVWASPFDYFAAPALTAFLVVGIGLIRFPETPLTTGVDLSYGVYLSHSVVLMALMNIYPFESWVALFALTLPLSYAIAYATWTFIEAPALGYKDWPERVARGVLGRVVPNWGAKSS